MAKVIARAGVCSRRDAERLVGEGRVSVNGVVIGSPALNVTGEDRIAIDGEALQGAETPRVWRYHKPSGRITTHRDPKGRPTVFDALPAELPRVVSVGRLDFTTEGLLLLTNAGALARHLELPATGWVRRYRVRVHGRPGDRHVAQLASGMEVDGVRYAPIEATVDRAQGANAWLTLALREGKNREIRRVMAALGFSVSRLIRTSYGPFQLGDLKTGAISEVAGKVLRDQLGRAMSAELGLTAARPRGGSGGARSKQRERGERGERRERRS